MSNIYYYKKEENKIKPLELEAYQCMLGEILSFVLIAYLGANIYCQFETDMDGLDGPWFFTFSIICFIISFVTLFTISKFKAKDRLVYEPDSLILRRNKAFSILKYLNLFQTILFLINFIVVMLVGILNKETISTTTNRLIYDVLNILAMIIAGFIWSLFINNKLIKNIHKHFE